VPLTLVQRTTAGTAAAATTVTATFAGTPVSGNLLLAYATADNVAAGTPMSGTGWTARASTVDFVGHYHYQKIAGGSEPTAVTWTAGGSGGGRRAVTVKKLAALGVG
jgi:hypothetical protein